MNLSCLCCTACSRNTFVPSVSVLVSFLSEFAFLNHLCICVWLPATSITCIIVIYLLWARGNLFSLSCVSQASLGMSHLLVIPPQLSSISYTGRTYLKCTFYWWNDKATLFSLHSSSFLDCGRLLDDLNHQMTEVTKLRRMLDDINTQPMETRSAP